MRPSFDFAKLNDYRVAIQQASRARETRVSYRNSWRRFSDWCGHADCCPFPASAETVTLYLTDTLLQGRKITSCLVYVSAINHMHRTARIPIPDPVTVRSFLESAQRLRCEKPYQAKPLDIALLRRMCLWLLASPKKGAIRDRAMLTLAFSSALRRGSLVALDLEDLRWMPKGLIVAIHREKQDQMGEGRLIGVEPGRRAETDPIAAMHAWLAIRGDQPGALFRSVLAPYRRLSGQAVALMIKAAIQGIGEDPALYSAHSTRSGFVTCAISNGCNEFTVARQTGHKSLRTLRLYFRQDDPFKANASSMLGM